MKQAQVKPGVRALLSLGKRGAVRVTVVELLTAAGYRTYDGAVAIGQPQWRCQDSSGRYHVATPRQLRPLPHVASQGELAAAYDAHLAQRLRVSSERGQTIDMGDTVIETTLHRLG